MISALQKLKIFTGYSLFKRELTKRAGGFRLPKRIILVRHGESLGNVDENAYATTPDWAIPLTENGKDQARHLGNQLEEVIGNDPILIYCSPYVRSKQTLKYLMEKLNDNEIIDAREEPRMAEQQFGNFQREGVKHFKEDRKYFGRFYYCFPEGESGSDVYVRVTSFIGTLFRDWSRIEPHVHQDMNVVIVTHGLTLRLFLMRWFHYTLEEYENSTNPPNCAFVCLNRYATTCKWVPFQFRLCDNGREMCNLPAKEKYLLDHTGRQHLDDLLKNID